MKAFQIFMLVFLISGCAHLSPEDVVPGAGYYQSSEIREAAHLSGAEDLQLRYRASLMKLVPALRAMGIYPGRQAFKFQSMDQKTVLELAGSVDYTFNEKAVDNEAQAAYIAERYILNAVPAMLGELEGAAIDYLHVKIQFKEMDFQNRSFRHFRELSFLTPWQQLGGLETAEDPIKTLLAWSLLELDGEKLEVDLESTRTRRLETTPRPLPRGLGVAFGDDDPRV